MTDPKGKSSTVPVASFPRDGGLDPTLERMKAHGLPLTQEQRLKLAMPEAPHPLPAELWAEIPPEIREDL